MYMHHKDGRTMRALDAFLVDHHNGIGLADGIPPDRTIGGVRLIALHEPIPSPGEPVRRFAWVPLAEYPNQVRHTWYHTADAKMAQRCGYAAPLGDTSKPAGPAGDTPRPAAPDGQREDER
jgi:hypothetical protein